ncbi:MAG TPA: RagB/SusD family nutrient uptake outer membrane protein [Puia sp.]|nr:RagB/SusD family nutrient uptake outer membrane protein [Puia sp.]
MRANNKLSFIIATAALLTATGCKKLLQEQPRSQITPAFFSTAGGILGGIAGVYSDMRFLWGTEGFTNITLAGTDEVLAGGSASGTYWWTYNNILTSDGATTSLWNIAYQDINTLNGVLQFGAVATIDSATKRQYLAQAKFLRAFYYFYLVQTFGSVPLHTSFITNATTSDTRQPIADIYTQIIQDLTEASTQLQVKPTAPFLGKPATQAAALYLLSKVYLTRGWSSAGSPSDFATAATIASNLIANQATYGIGLNPDYATANAPGNEYGQEILFVIDREADLKYGERTTGTRASGSKENGTNFFFRPNYPSVSANYPASGGAAIMTRDIANGRPFIRIRPNTSYVLNQAFVDQADDSRYSKTFQTVWIANTAGISTPRGALTVGKDTGIWTPPYEVPAAQVAAFKGVVFTPLGTNGANAYTTVIFPSMSKYDDPNRADVNDASTRPLILFKFSEVYLLAAEAYFKAGDNTNAAAMLNVIRQRAAYRSTNTAAQNAASVAAMTILPGDVTLDFIMDERTRELFGECQRWWDLVRTQTLNERLQRFNPTEAYTHYSTSSPANAFMLRPIPQSEIDLVTSGPVFPQNPGY